MIGEDGRMNEAAGETFAGMTAAEASTAVVAALREQGLLRGEEPYEHSVPFSERSGERIEPLISLQWFCRMEELAAPAIEVVERDEVRIVPEQLQAGLSRMDAQHPALVRLAPALVGPSDPGLVRPRGRGDRRRDAELARRGCARAGHRSRRPDARTTTFSTPGSARRSGRSRPLAGPTRTPHLQAFYPTSLLTRARDHLPLGRADGDDGDRVRRRHPVSRRLRPLRSSRRPTVAGCRSRSAPASTRSTRSRSTAPTRCASACWRCRRPRTSAFRPSASSRAATSPTRCGTPRGSSC